MDRNTPPLAQGADSNIETPYRGWDHRLSETAASGWSQCCGYSHGLDGFVPGAHSTSLSSAWDLARCVAAAAGQRGLPDVGVAHELFIVSAKLKT